MSVRHLAAALNEALDGKATCSSATMHYERDEAENIDRQVVNFRVLSAQGNETVVSFAGKATWNPTEWARQAARTYLEGLETEHQES